MISACVVVRNEEKNIPRLIESLKECDEIIIADGGSTDKTMELAKSLGAIVYSRNDKFDIPTQEDIDGFKKTFGFIPEFTTESKLRNGENIRNSVVEKAKHDWIFFPDGDEFVTWDIGEINKLMKKYDSIDCPIIQMRDKKDNPLFWNNITKLYNKNKTRWFGRVHEVIYALDNKIHTDKMKINHYPKENTQGDVTAILEYDVYKTMHQRSFFYLARQYFYKNEWQHCLDMFEHYMKTAFWRPEISYAFFLRAKCAWQLQMGDKARIWCLNAIAINPDFKEALQDMAIYTGDDQSPYWKRYANIATSNNVLFVNTLIS